MDAELAQDQAEIEKLAVDINNAIVGVPDVDQILADTADNVLMATELKNEAEAVQKEAKTQLDIAEKIIRELSNAAVSQDAAEEAVIQTRNDIDSARTNLGQVSYFFARHFIKLDFGSIQDTLWVFKLSQASGSNIYVDPGHSASISVELIPFSHV